jgi:hypothetical protein
MDFSMTIKNAKNVLKIVKPVLILYFVFHATMIDNLFKDVASAIKGFIKTNKKIVIDVKTFV